SKEPRSPVTKWASKFRSSSSPPSGGPALERREETSMIDRIKDILARIPVAAIVAVLVGYVGFDFYTFQNGELQHAKDDLAAQTVEVEGMANKVQQAKKFYETLNQKRAELRGLAQQLEQMKAS